MRNQLICTLSLLALGVSAQAQNAGDPPAGNSSGNRTRQTAEERFNLLDTNKDGKLSQSEYVAGGNSGGANQGQGQRTANREERFKSMNTNKDDYLSLDEYKVGRASMGQRQGQSRRGEKT